MPTLVKMNEREKSISRKELADALDINTETAATFLRSVGIRPGEPLTPKNYNAIRFGCHPLLFDMSRELLGKIYKLDSATVSKRLKKIGINHSKKLSPGEVEQIYQVYRIPASLKKIGIDHQNPTVESVKQFCQKFGITKSEKWYRLYFELLIVRSEDEPFDSLTWLLRSPNSR